MIKTAKFNVGTCVIHKQHHYRAVVIDVDPLFQASGHYNPQASKRAFAIRNPWYRLLVDGSSQMTYVEETFLKPDPAQHRIDNPKVSHYLHEKQGYYYSNHRRH